MISDQWCFYSLLFLAVGKVLTILLLSKSFSVISGVKFAGNLTIFYLFVSSIVEKHLGETVM